MHHVTRIDELPGSQVPAAYADRSRGYSRQLLAGSSTGSPHMGLFACHLEPTGHTDAVVHSFEASLYVLSGELVVSMLGQSIRLPLRPLPQRPGRRGLHRAGPVPRAGVLAPDERTGAVRGRSPQQDTFFTGEQPDAADAPSPDLRDPRNRNAFRFDPSSMDLGNLAGIAGGQAVDAPAVSASMATALLAYSGIGVQRRLIDQRMGAQRALHTMPSSGAVPADCDSAPARPPVRGGLRRRRG